MRASSKTEHEPGPEPRPEPVHDPANLACVFERLAASEIVVFEISNSMKPCPSAFHAYTSTLRPAIGFC